MKRMFALFVLSLSLALLVPVHTNAIMTGGSFELYADNFSFVDGSTTTGDIFSLMGSGGEMAATTTVTDLLTLRGGFQAVDKGNLSFVVSPGGINLGTLSPGAVSVGSVTLTASSDSQTGYSVVATADGALRTTGGATIPYVSDGSVTAGSREYGIRTVGTDGLVGSDTGLSGPVTVASADGAVSLRETTVRFSAAMDQGAPEGNYSQIVTFTATVNP